MTQAGPNGECLRCVLNWAFAPEPDVSVSLRYGHFEVELDDDGIPIALGAGAMAVTYRARDTVLNSVVALKVIARKLAENPIARARFLREARAAAQIHHPNVARVIHYGEQDGECFYAMELVQGETLEARVQRTRTAAGFAGAGSDRTSHARTRAPRKRAASSIAISSPRT